ICRKWFKFVVNRYPRTDNPEGITHGNPCFVISQKEKRNVRCSQCDHENREQARFCDECGASMRVRCHACSTVNRPGAKFCDGCGAALISLSSSSAAHSIPRQNTDEPSSSPYTPRYLSEDILATRSALEGERKLVTVLFADIADSSMFAQQLDAERLHSLLDK